MSGQTPPFEPTERNGNLYARGAVDDKGQMYMHVKALEALLQATRRQAADQRESPLRRRRGSRRRIDREVSCAREGTKLKADFALVSDTELFAPDLPTLCVGLRGLVYTEIEALGAMTDLHSGMYGGAAPNPFFGADRR